MNNFNLQNLCETRNISNQLTGYFTRGNKKYHALLLPWLFETASKWCQEERTLVTKSVSFTFWHFHSLQAVTLTVWCPFTFILGTSCISGKMANGKPPSVKWHDLAVEFPVCYSSLDFWIPFLGYVIYCSVFTLKFYRSSV